MRARPTDHQSPRGGTPAKDGPINVACVNVGNYLGRGEEYTDRLYRGIARHLTQGFLFHCITTAPGEGWWAKISLFEPGRFTGRCLYFDLDTVIVGSLDDLAAYRGDFAGIDDFYHPDLLQTGVMAWDADKVGHIFTRWRDCGMPQFHQRGDAAWIAEAMPKADRLQAIYPDQLVSFKAHCVNGVPVNARVVCFHGKPRPHVLADLMRQW